MIDASTTFHLLVNGGFALGIVGENLTVRPVSRLTEQLREAIRANKPELLALLRKANPHAPPPLSDAGHEAIREQEAGEPREVAEREVAAGMRVFQYRLADKPNRWLIVLAPGCDLDEARHALTLRFGPERLIDVREHRTAPHL
ncbi:hypothetical protein [Thiocapsa rosea]|uniref:TubC N-terminal docking domain-containing protein n=1 Tax=Thiocapsa rosea TaxID=69360 RepID=A0A495VDM5_9GAMM|nr:hypothetical protein [Thiocapsa rosea]RKT47496.1 hypothetical protein BDD21_5088 [Thiocapsa rosea]